MFYLQYCYFNRTLIFILKFLSLILILFNKIFLKYHNIYIINNVIFLRHVVLD